MWHYCYYYYYTFVVTIVHTFPARVCLCSIEQLKLGNSSMELLYHLSPQWRKVFVTLKGKSTYFGVARTSGLIFCHTCSHRTQCTFRTTRDKGSSCQSKKFCSLCVACGLIFFTLLLQMDITPHQEQPLQHFVKQTFTNLKPQTLYEVEAS